MALHAAKHYSAYIKDAKLAEEENDIKRATELYELAIKQKPIEEQPYERLMIFYRKSKNYEKELKIIDKALDIFQNYYKEKAEKIYGKNKKLEQVGKALLKSIQPKDSKPYFPQPISKWIKRKQTVEKKLQSKSN